MSLRDLDFCHLQFIMVKFTLKKKITKPVRRNQSLNVFEKNEEAAAKEIQISTVDSTSSTKQNDTNLRIIHPPKDTWSIHAKKHKPSEPEVELPDVADDSDPTADSYQSVPVKDFGIAMLRGMGFQEKGKEKK
ncbi:BA75_03631T0 [Komagataella pastoris]|uniref:BA75_03631T0 n=1 Tax=Komagataella pastoris TaxID=4922 RepID=A0A1B2JGB2_PICPA|nr:BA75_03631T0 [Komagataella pastoris]